MEYLSRCIEELRKLTQTRSNYTEIQETDKVVREPDIVEHTFEYRCFLIGHVMLNRVIEWRCKN